MQDLSNPTFQDRRLSSRSPMVRALGFAYVEGHIIGMAASENRNACALLEATQRPRVISTLAQALSRWDAPELAL